MCLQDQNDTHSIFGLIHGCAQMDRKAYSLCHIFQINAVLVNGTVRYFLITKIHTTILEFARV